MFLLLEVYHRLQNYQPVIVNRMCFAQIVETKRTHKDSKTWFHQHSIKKLIDSKISRIIVTG